MTRRLFSLFLVVLLAVPFSALGAVEAQSVKVLTLVMDESGQSFQAEAVPDVDYVWNYTDATRTAGWLQLLPQSAVNPSAVCVVLNAGADWNDAAQQYLLVDAMTGSEWLDLSNGMGQSSAYSLRNALTGEATEGLMLTVSTDAMPASSGGGEPPVITPAVTNETLPEGRETDSLRMRYAASLVDAPNGGVLDSLAEGEVLTFTGNSYNDETGALWCQVQKENGAAGYVPLAALSFLTQAEYAAYQASKVVNQTMPERQSDYARLTGDGALYNAPDGAVVATLSSDAVARYDGQTSYNGADGRLWVLVQSGDAQGYVPVNNLAFLSAQEEAAYLTPPVENQTMPPRESNYMFVNGDTALYAAPDGAATGSLAAGSAARFDGTSAANGADGKLWVYVETANASGYLPVNSVRFMTAQEETAYLTPPVENQTMPPRESNYVVVNGDTALYAAPDGVATGSLAAGSAARFDGMSAANGADGKLWVYVETANASGYLPVNSVRFMTAQEETEHLKTPAPTATATVAPTATATAAPTETATIAPTATATARPNQTMPPRESDYMMMNGANALYTAPEGIAIGSLAAGSVARFDGSNAAYGSDGALWIRVESGTQAGYLPVSGVTFLTAAQEAELRKTAAPTATAAATATATVAPTATAAPTAPSVAGHARVISNNVNVRRSPGGAAFTQAGAGQVVYVESAELDAAGNVWYCCQLPGNQVGWIVSDFVRVMTPDEEAAYLATLVTATPTVAPTPTLAPTPSPTPYLRMETGYKRTILQGVPLLSWANVGAPYSAVLGYGEAVYVTEQTYDATGTLLDLVYYNGSWGYMRSNYLAPMSAQEINNYFATPAPTPRVSPTYSTAGFSGYALVTSQNGGSVNFRTAPSMGSSSVIARLSSNTLVRVLGEMTSEGYTWYQCECNGSSGYMRGDFLRLLSVAEYTYVLSSGNYNTGSATVRVTATARTVTSTTWSTNPPSQSQQGGTLTFITIAPLRATATAAPVVTAAPTLRPTFAPLATVSASPAVSPSALATVTPTAGAQGFGVVVTPAPSASATASGEFPTEKNSGFSSGGLLIALAALLVLIAGGFYGYSVYNKSRRRQAEERARRMAERRRQGQPPQDGQRPAVRRPAPPTQPSQSGDFHTRYARETAPRATTQSGETYRQEMENARQPSRTGAYPPTREGAYQMPRGERDTNDRPRDAYDRARDTSDRPRDAYDRARDVNDRPRDAYDRTRDTNDRPRDAYDRTRDVNDRPRDAYDRTRDTNDRPRDTNDRARDENPYARPMNRGAEQSAEYPERPVRSTLPRASVDGRDVGDARNAPEGYRARRMPVAPPPVTDEEAQQAARRRKRAEYEDGAQNQPPRE